MLKNYLKIGLRNLVKHKALTILNIIGLAIGMSCFMLISLFVYNESGFDRFHQDYENIYRLTEINYAEGGETRLANAYSAIGPALQSDFPEFSSFTRIHVDEFTVGTDVQHEFQEKNFAFVDSSFWKVFDYQLIEGNPTDALTQPFSLVLSEQASKRHFGEESPVGKVLKVDGQYDFQVVGLMKDMPKNSHLKLDIIASFVSLRQMEGGWMFNNWYWPPMYTYVKIPKSVNVEAIENKFPSMMKKNLGEIVAGQRGYELQPIAEIHTSTGYSNELGETINKAYLYVLATTAFFVLAIACINFMNLSLVRSIGRSNEVGIRKVFGAIKPQIIGQYLIESVLSSLIAALLSLGVFYLTLPAFNALAQRELSVSTSGFPAVLLGLIGIAILVGLISGLYPSLYLSGFSPSAILKGKIAKQGKWASIFKKILIVLQFFVSSVLIISTVIIYYQLNFLRNKSLGFDKEQVVVLEIKSDANQGRIKMLKDQLRQLPQVKSVAVSSRIPGHEGFYDYNVLPEGESVENNLLFMRLESDLDFTSVYGLNIVAGRNFNSNLSTDSSAYLLNQTAVEKLGWSPEQALNKKLYMGSVNSSGSFQAVHQGRIIGVVKDFNFKSLHNKIDPVVISIIPKSQPYMQSKLSVKFTSGVFSEHIKVVEQVWDQFAPNEPMEYFFLDETVRKLYEKEKQLGRVFLTFSSISIILACMGLFAMTTLLATQMRREIGIRKVLGATVQHITWRISSEFIQLISLSFAMACLISYFVMKNWLENFAFQIDIEPWYFLLSGLLMSIIVLATLSAKSVKAAFANPVDSLRHE